MSLRIYPFRQYNETDVINMFASDTADSQPSTNGNGSAGVFVKVSAGNLDQDPIGLAANGYLGNTNYPFLGADYYPSVPLQFTAATAGAPVLGITLNQTLQYDENNEKLLYNPQKRAELQAVLSGQAVPVATKGLFMLADSAIDWDSNIAVGNRLVISANAGKVSGIALGTTGKIVVGQIYATGTRTSQNLKSDLFVGTGSGKMALVLINCQNPSLF